MVSSVSWHRKTFARTPWSQASFAPFCFLLGFALLAAASAAYAPFQLTITSVFLFAGLHNWVELRYFLSKVPTRLGPLKSYFAAATIGGIALSGAYIALLTLPTLFYLQTAWNALFVSWICGLILLRGTQNPKRKVNWAIPLAAVAVAMSGIGPAWLPLLLVYAHPLIGMAILDRELQRKPGWRRAYRWVLCTLPPLAVLVFLTSSSSMPATTNQALLWNLYTQAGCDFLPMLPASSLIALHAFLELLHYGVWLLAIPLTTMFVGAAHRRRSSLLAMPIAPRELPISRVSPKSRTLILSIFTVATIAVLALWCAFSIDYTNARQFYFTIAIVHMLAEIPFLIRLL